MSTNTTVSTLRQRMIEDMTARKLGPHSQRSHIHSCRRFAAFLKRSPDMASADDVRRFQLHLVEAGLGVCNRNRIMTGVKFLFRVTLRRHDLAAEIYHLKEEQKLPLTMSPNEAERLLTMAGSLRDGVMLSLGYGCGLRAGEIVRLKDGDIDSAQMIIRIVSASNKASLLVSSSYKSGPGVSRSDRACRKPQSQLRPMLLSCKADRDRRSRLARFVHHCRCRTRGAARRSRDPRPCQASLTAPSGPAAGLPRSVGPCHTPWHWC